MSIQFGPQLDSWATIYGLTRRDGESDEALYERIVRYLHGPTQSADVLRGGTTNISSSGSIGSVPIRLGDTLRFSASSGAFTWEEARADLSQLQPTPPSAARPLTGSAAEIAARQAKPPELPPMQTEAQPERTRWQLLEVDEGPLSPEIQAYLRDWRLKQQKRRIPVEQAPYFVRAAAKLTGYRGEN